MPSNEIGEFLRSELKCSIVEFNEDMRRHTSFRIGGKADVFVSPGSIDEMALVIKKAKELQIPIRALGNGSNLLVSDNGIKSIVLDCKSAANGIVFNNDRVNVSAGCILKTFCENAAEHELSGVEQAVGIPGTIGGALVMNAGANGYNIGNIVENVTVMDMNGDTFKIKKGELSFEYRHSSLKEAGYIILEAELALKKGNKNSLLRLMREELETRERKFPLNYPNAGSIFKRPKEGYPGQWVEMAGCKGMRIGDAEVSTKHANFIINKGSAKAGDVADLISQVKDIVAKKFSVNLEKEVIYWGM